MSILQGSSKTGILYIVTKLGYIHVYDAETATCLYTNRISQDTIFCTCLHDATQGILGVNRKGQVRAIDLFN